MPIIAGAFVATAIIAIGETLTARRARRLRRRSF